MEEIEFFLETKGLKITKKMIPTHDGKINITYVIVQERGDTEYARLSIFVSDNDEEDITSDLDAKQLRDFNKGKKEPLFCFVAWINGDGTKTYKNFGKLIMFYMMLDLSQDYKFIIKLDNSSGSKETYKFFGFKDFNGDEEEIMSSVLLPQIKRKMTRITYEN
jgi:hypothetical protein